jgi:prepilin-type N-terminal cleavage/methylation domain-containing protein
MKFIHRRNSGVTLVEMIVAVAVIGFVAVSSILALQMITKAGVATNLEGMAHIKMRAVADLIREQAVDFENMDETPNNPQLPNYYPKITVLSTVFPVNPTTRTRDVKLVASWKDTSAITDKVITSTFSVMNIRGKKMGGGVKLKVVDIHDGVTGIPNVSISGPGQDISKVPNKTDAHGVCELSNIKLGSGIEITIDGTPVRHFFITGSDVYFSTGVELNILPNHIDETYFLNPIQMYPPGVITGRVTDITAHAPTGVPNADVVLVNKPGTQLIPVGIDNSEKMATTNAQGYYFFRNIMPTRAAGVVNSAGYDVFLLGSDSYAALATPGDGVAATDPNSHLSWLAVDSKQTVTKNFATITKGSIEGRFFGTSSDSSGNFTIGSPVGPTRIFAIRSNSESCQGLPCTNANKINLAQTFVWEQYFGSKIPAYQDKGNNTTLTSSGEYSFDYITPRISTPSSSSAMENQFNLVVISPNMADVPDPYTPILVLGTPAGSNLTNVRFLLGAGKTPGELANAATMNGTIDDFRFQLFNNQTLTQNFYLLNKNSLSRVAGDVSFFETDGITNFNLTGHILEHSIVRVGTHTITPGEPSYGYGGVRFKATPDRSSFDRNYGVDTTFHSNFMHRYDMGRALPPNLGGTETVLRYTGVINSSPENTDFRAYVFAREKIRVGGNNFAYPPIPRANIGGGDPLQVRIWLFQGEWVIVRDKIPATLTNGELSVPNVSNIVRDVIEFEGTTSKLSLTPGGFIDHRSGAATDLADISAIRKNDNRTYVVEVMEDPNFRWAKSRGPCEPNLSPTNPACGPLFYFNTASNVFMAPQNYHDGATYTIDYPTAILTPDKIINLYKIARTGVVSGIVYYNGTPAQNSTVSLEVSGFSTPTSVNTNSDGEFSMSGIPFVPRSGINLTLTASFLGQSETKTVEIADGEDWDVDFNLTGIVNYVPGY